MYCQRTPLSQRIGSEQLPGLNCFVTIKHDLQVTLVRYVTPIKSLVNLVLTNHYIQLNSDCPTNTSLPHVYIFSYSRLTRNMVNI